MGKQYNKVIKRKRWKSYLGRKKEREKAALTESKSKTKKKKTTKTKK